MFHACNNIVVLLLAFSKDDLFLSIFSFGDIRAKLWRDIPFKTFNEQRHFRET